MRDQFELVFSTGPQPVPTTIAGIVWDRLTGRGAADYEVRAVGTEGDSSVHVSMTDTGGVFGLRFLPTPTEVNGLSAFRFQLTAFEDRNRDNIVDPTEVQGTRRGLVNAAEANPDLGQDELAVAAVRLVKARFANFGIPWERVDDAAPEDIDPLPPTDEKSRTEDGGPADEQLLSEEDCEATEGTS